MTGFTLRWKITIVLTAAWVVIEIMLQLFGR